GKIKELGFNADEFWVSAEARLLLKNFTDGDVVFNAAKGSEGQQ
ncbi:MAG: hypothetical protein ACI974_001185, partial [Paraglaciecola sp.]